jgi:hypothetical protein
MLHGFDMVFMRISLLLGCGRPEVGQIEGQICTVRNALIAIAMMTGLAWLYTHIASLPINNIDSTLSKTGNQG